MRTSVGRDPEVKYRQSGRTGGNVAETQLYIQNQMKVQHLFMVEKSRKKSEMAKSDEKISFSLLESAPKGPQIYFLSHQIRLEKLHLKIRFREYG